MWQNFGHELLPGMLWQAWLCGLPGHLRTWITSARVTEDKPRSLCVHSHAGICWLKPCHNHQRSALTSGNVQARGAAHQQVFTKTKSHCLCKKFALQSAPSHDVGGWGDETHWYCTRFSCGFGAPACSSKMLSGSPVCTFRESGSTHLLQAF